jgi:hypothetical protein
MFCNVTIDGIGKNAPYNSFAVIPGTNAIAFTPGMT